MQSSLPHVEGPVRIQEHGRWPSRSPRGPISPRG